MLVSRGLAISSSANFESEASTSDELSSQSFAYSLFGNGGLLLELDGEG